VPNWITSSGLLGNVNKGNIFSYALSCYDVLNLSFSIISGKLPPGLAISHPTDGSSIPYPSIWGTISTAANTGIYSFTIRATNTAKQISDITFSLNILDLEPVYVYSSSNLGRYKDGSYIIANVMPISPTPLIGNVSIISGSLPPNLFLNTNTGIISGYINPSCLYNTIPMFTNIDSTGPLLPDSNISNIFSITVQYDAINNNNYNITVVRADSF
jgi:hypothetical protein